MRNALTAIEWPDDELRVYASLRGPLFAFSDDALFLYRQTLSADGELQVRRLHPMHPLDRTQLEPAAQEVADALALLGRLHVGRNHRPIAQTILMLLDAVRAHAGIAMWPTGEQALANCMRMVGLARATILIYSSRPRSTRPSRALSLKMTDYNPDVGTLIKSGQARHVTLTGEAPEFLDRLTAGRSPGAALLRRGNGGGWKRAEQLRPVRAACA